MNTITERTQHVFLQDNLLDGNYFQEISTYADNLKFSPLEGAENFPLWKIENRPAFPVCGEKTYVWTDNVAGKKTLQDIQSLSVFPTGSIIDGLIEKIHEVAISSGLLGVIGKDWAGSISRFYKYGHGTAVNWHRDNMNYTGAFICYLNKSWDQDWGGYFQHKEKGSTDGQFISPEPNRLILVKTPYLHSISPVTCPLTTSRLSLTGFFVKPDRAEHIIREFKAQHC